MPIIGKPRAYTWVRVTLRTDTKYIRHPFKTKIGGQIHSVAVGVKINTKDEAIRAAARKLIDDARVNFHFEGKPVAEGIHLQQTPSMSNGGADGSRPPADLEKEQAEGVTLKKDDWIEFEVTLPEKPPCMIVVVGVVNLR